MMMRMLVCVLALVACTAAYAQGMPRYRMVVVDLDCGTGGLSHVLVVDEQEKTIRTCSLTAGNNRPDHHWESNGVCYPPTPMKDYETWKDRTFATSPPSCPPHHDQYPVSVALNPDSGELQWCFYADGAYRCFKPRTQ
jgi:hypothetical protein